MRSQGDEAMIITEAGRRSGADFAIYLTFGIDFTLSSILSLGPAFVCLPTACHFDDHMAEHRTSRYSVLGPVSRCGTSASRDA